MDGGAWWAAVQGVSRSQERLSDVTFTFQFPALEKEMATHSNVLAWRIPGTAEPGGLPSLQLQSRTQLKRLSSSSSSRAPSFRDETVSKNQAQLLSLPYNSRKQIFILLVIYPMYKMEFPFWIDLLSRHFSYSYFMLHMAIHTQ